LRNRVSEAHAHGLKAAENRLAIRLRNIGLADAREIAWATVWLEACGYTGFKFLAEALAMARAASNSRAMRWASTSRTSPAPSWHPPSWRR
jgi:hypothetical protein